MRVVNLRREKYTHYIGRGSVFGNPFRIGRDGNRDDVIRKYKDYLPFNKKVLTAIENLPEDAVLGCYCKPRACHGDIIIQVWKELHKK